MAHWTSCLSCDYSSCCNRGEFAALGREDLVAERVVEVVLPNDTVALVQVIDVDGAAGRAEKVSSWKESFDFEHVSGMLEGISQSIRSGLSKARPTRTAVELGIDLAVRNG